MPKSKKIRLIFLTYWILLGYIIVALIWWFIALNRQNDQMAYFKVQDLHKNDAEYDAKHAAIQSEKKRKTAQYIGEGSIFFLLIAAGAIFVYRAVNRELTISRQQQNFMMALTHELKTPIAVAKINLETLQKRKLDESQQQRLISNTLQETNRLNSLCNNMLISSQIEAGGYRTAKEEINFSELLENCVSDFRQRFPQRSINASIEKDLFVNGDNLLLQIAINNLIDNALKYSSKEDEVTLKASQHQSTIQVSVADEGPGISDEEKRKVFNKFYRVGNEATKTAKGTGLGLFLTSKIIATHGGSITVKDNLPKGIIFTIELKEVV